MGCEVVVFSGTEGKRAEAMRLGASEFYAMKGREGLEGVRGLDHLLVTTSEQPDWGMYIGVMNPLGTIMPISVSESELKMPYMDLLWKGLRVQFGLVAGRQMHREMLAFAAFHGVKPMLEEFPLTAEGIEAAMAKLETGKMRYRAVLIAES